MVAAKQATAWLEGELAALRSRPETGLAEIARVEAIASGCRADFERDRAERLAAECSRPQPRRRQRRRSSNVS
jgi:hypothetical protein